MNTNGPPEQRKSLQHEAHKLPVTALAFFGDDILLSGEGTRLNGYDVRTQNRLNSVQIFSSQAIHGIVVVPRSKLFVVYGGQHLRAASLVTSDTGAVTFALGKVIQVGDWIFDASFGSTRDESDLVLAIVTAHNALYIATSPDNHEALDTAWTIRNETPRSNAILYAAHITWLSSAQLLIAAGTAFGDVILWSYQVNTTQNEPASSSRGIPHIHYTFSAHEGSVFGVFISPPVKDGSLHAVTRFLATCSDDRSIRVWDISDLSRQSASVVEKIRDTGFGTRCSEDENSPILLARTMAHTSRIWSVRTVTSQHGDVQLMSFGEDATAITWRMAHSTFPKGLPCQLSQIQDLHPHSGKNIWSVTTHASGLIATGGADGAIALIEHDSRRSRDNTVEIGCELSAMHEGDNFKSYTLLGSDIMFATTRDGRIVTVESGAQNVATAREICHLSALRSYSIVAGSLSIAFAGGTDGRVYAYLRGSDTVILLRQSTRKIAGLFVSEIGQSSDDSKVALLITRVNSSDVEVCTLRPAVGEEQQFDEHFSQHFELPANFGVTSFIYIPGSTQRSLVILGSRQGSLAVFALPQEGSDEPLIHDILIPEVHGSEAITSLRWLPIAPESSEHNVLGHLFSTGRDGTYAVQRISIGKEQSGASLQLVHQLELPFGPNIEGISTNDKGEVLVWGFRRKHFALYSITSQREIMTVNCGGAHRNWAFNLAVSGQGGTFVWTQASMVYRFTQDGLSWSLINAGGHGREIKTMAVWRRAGFDTLIATGAEDTDIRIFSVNSIESEGSSSTQSSRGLRLVQLLRKHNTGPQHLAFSSCGRYLFSSGGFEEFFVWRIEHDIPGVGIGVVCESAHPRSGSSDLRITSFDVRESHDGSSDHGTVWQITLAYSDSSIAIWTYNDALGQWKHQAAADYLTACLTHVLDLSHSVNSGDHFITTATDGHIALWHPDPAKEDASPCWTERHRAHQSAIQSALIHRLSDGSWLVITGGDDNAISLTRSTTTAQSPERWSTLTIPRAHAAAVTALALVRTPRIDDLHRETLCLLSAGLDQRVKIWNVRVDMSKSRVDGVDVDKAGSACINIADVVALGVIVDECSGRERSARIVIAGVGVEILRLPPLSK